jgi:hypothetical protein
MYAWPVLLPAQTNREDFLRTVSLFDDDTGQAIDVSGRTLAVPGDFTGNAWTVVSGTTVTASVTQLTIKDYPFGNEMQATSATVGINLPILAGAPVTIADATGKNTMTGYVTSYAPATGVLVAQIGVAFAFEIRGSHHNHDCDYGASWSAGNGGDAALIAAQLSNGLSVIDVGKVQVRLPVTLVQKLHHKTYWVGMAMFDGSDTRHVFIGELPVLFGGNPVFAVPSFTPNPFGLP